MVSMVFTSRLNEHLQIVHPGRRVLSRVDLSSAVQNISFIYLHLFNSYIVALVSPGWDGSSGNSVGTGHHRPPKRGVRFTVESA